MTEMENATTIISVVVVLTVLALVIVFSYRRRGKIHMRVPGIRFDAEGSNDRRPAIHVEDARSTAGGVTLDDATGTGITASRIEAKKDISLRAGGSGHQPPKT